MKVIFGDQFIKSADKLPSRIQKKLDGLLVIMSRNPYDPLLHTKRLSGVLAGYFSFRITREWRALFQFLDSQTLQLLRIAHRKDIYR